MRKLAVLIGLSVVVSIAGATTPRAQFRQMEEENRTLKHELEMIQKQLDRLETVNDRLIWLCQQNNVDPGKAYDDSVWPDSQFTPPLTIGQIARFGDKNYLKVFQIVDASNMIAEIKLPYLAGSVWTNKEATVWISGISTAGLTDGKRCSFKVVFEVCGTKTYATALGGSKTIFELRPSDKLKNW